MYRQTVTIHPESPNMPLKPLWVGQGSAAVIVLSGVPSGASAAIVLTPVGGGTKLLYAASQGEVFMPGWAFPLAGDTRYAVEFTTGAGDTARTFWAGRGELHVWDAETNADIPTAPAVRSDGYIYIPADGKWHLITGDYDPVTGLFTSATGQEGFDEIPEGGHAI